MPSLIIVGKKEGEVSLGSDVTVIGRDRGVSLELSDFQVSRRHALVIRTDDGCWVKDLGSRNGVLVNKARVPTRRQQRLKNGDVLVLGRTSIVFKDLEVGPLPEEAVQLLANPPALPKNGAGFPSSESGISESGVSESGRSEADRTPEKAAPEKPAQEKPAPEKAVAEKPVAEKAVAEKAVAEKAVAEKPVAERVAADKTSPDKLADPAKPAAADKAGADKLTIPPGREPAVAAVAAAPAGRARFQELAADDAEAPDAALAPAAGPLLPRGDQVALRQLLRRAESERVFYRNLTLGLVGFLMLVLVALLFYALGRSDRHPEDGSGAPRSSKSDKANDGPPGSGKLARVPGPISVPLGRAGELDAHVFADAIQPLLVRSCATAGCHQGRGAGELILEGKTDPATVSKDLDVVRRFVVPGRPERSPLLTKALKRDEGGEEHGGGDILSASSPAYKTIREWIARAAPRTEDDERPKPRPAFSGSENDSGPDAKGPKGTHRPIARINASAVTGVRIGTPITLDATGSSDPESCELTYHWTLIDRPDRSRSELGSPLTPRATLVPDAEGSYLIDLVVNDALGPSEPAKITIECSGAAGPMAPQPSGGESGGAASVPVAPATPPPAKKPSGGTRLKDDPIGRMFVREVMIDLLGRGPKPDEAAAYLDKSREDFVADLITKDELYQEWYEQELLYFLLIDNFRPADEVTDIPRKLKAKEMTVRDAIHATVIGQYFNQRNPGNDTFVTVVLEQLLGLKVQEKQNKKLLDAGKKMYDGYAATLFGRMGNKQADVVRIVVGERGFAEHLLRRTYRRVTGLDIEKDELSQAADRLEKDGGAFFEIMKDWVLSPKYVERVPLLRSKSERAFIRTLFVDVLQRIPEEEELRNARNAIRALADPGPLKAVLAKLLLDSPKAKLALDGDSETFVKNQFVRLLARDPKPAELAAYKKALDEGTSRETIVRALVTCTEYEGY